MSMLTPLQNAGGEDGGTRSFFVFSASISVLFGVVKKISQSVVTASPAGPSPPFVPGYRAMKQQLLSLSLRRTSFQGGSGEKSVDKRREGRYNEQAICSEQTALADVLELVDWLA